MKNGYIKVWRKIQHSDMYKQLNSKQRDVLMQCLLLANHKKRQWNWGEKLFICEPGQFITSLSNLVKCCGRGTKVQSVRTSLLVLQKWQFLTCKSTKTGRLITICNWVTYQCSEVTTNKDSNRQPTKNQQRANKELTTNKNVKNVKNVNKKKEKVQEYKTTTTASSYFDPVINPPGVSDVIEQGHKIGYPITEETAERFIDYYSTFGWIIKGSRIYDWTRKLPAWKNSEKSTLKASIFNAEAI